MNERLTKVELIQRVAKQTHLDAKQVEPIVEATLEEIYEAIKEGNTVSLRNFGTFYVRPERSTWVFKFTPAQRLRKVLNWSSTYKGDL